MWYGFPYLKRKIEFERQNSINNQAIKDLKEMPYREWIGRLNSLKRLEEAKEMTEEDRYKILCDVEKVNSK